MMKFRVCHAPPYEQTAVSIPMTDRYFTVDTAERATLEAWKKKNPHNLTYIFDGDIFMGFMEILPLTRECGELFDRQELLEEDLTADFILPPDEMHAAEYVYISGIAVPDTASWRSKCAAAALVSCGAGMIRHLYGGGQLKKIFANPTTYWGNRIIGRFGLRPAIAHKKPLRAGNDIYVATADAEFWTMIERIEKRYQRFIIDYPWPIA
jgi:hypothetical protein